MSEQHDKRKTVKLTPKNARLLERKRKIIEPTPSLNAIANAAIAVGILHITGNK